MEFVGGDFIYCDEFLIDHEGYSRGCPGRVWVLGDNYRDFVSKG